MDKPKYWFPSAIQSTEQEVQPSYDEVMQRLETHFMTISSGNQELENTMGITFAAIFSKVKDSDYFKDIINSYNKNRFEESRLLILGLGRIFYTYNSYESPLEHEEALTLESEQWEQQRTELVDAARHLIATYKKVSVHSNGLLRRRIEHPHLLPVKMLTAWVERVEYAPIDRVVVGAYERELMPITGIRGSKTTTETRTKTMVFRKIHDLLPVKVNDKAAAIRSFMLIIGIEITAAESRSRLEAIRKGNY